MIGTSSSPQTITLTNGGVISFFNLTLGLSGANPSVFAQTNNCGPTLEPSASCSITVIFHPSAMGAASAALSLSYNSGNISGNYSFVGLKGNAPQVPVTLAAQSGQNLSIAVANGQPATYALSATAAGGYSGTLALNCQNLPANASCNFSPTKLSLTSGTSTSFNLTIATSSAIQSTAISRFGYTLAAFVLLLPLGLWRRNRLLGAFPLLLLAPVLIMIGSGGCGNSSHTSAPTPPAQAATVAPGTYIIRVVASSSGIQVTQPITLTVQ